MSTHGQVRRRAGAVMWVGIGASALLLIALTARGWGRDAWGAAAGMLFLVCVGVCVWAAVASERSMREVREVAERLAAARRGIGNTNGKSPINERDD